MSVLQPTGRLMRLPARRFCLTVLFALSIALPNPSPSYSFADDKPSQPPTHDAVAPKETIAERPPFDLTYVPSDAAGVLALRPNVIFSDPAMQPLANMANEGLKQLLEYLKLPVDPKLPVEDIEQIVGNIAIHSNKDGKGGSHHVLTMELTMIRATHDFDWRKLLRQIDPESEEIHHEGRLYYRSHYPKSCPIRFSPAATFRYFLPDKRTVVFLHDTTLPAFLAGSPDKRPHFAWDKDWKHIEHGLFAAAMDDRWAHGLSKEQISARAGLASPFVDSTTRVVGVDWKDGIDLQAYLAYKEPAQAKEAIRDLKTFLAESLRTMKQDAPGESKAERRVAVFYVKLCETLVNQMHLTRRESTVCVHTKAKMSVAGFVKGIMLNISLTPR